MRDGFRCQECGAFPGEHKDVFLEVDHVVPVAKGGSNHINNLQTLCSVCNLGKGTDPAAPVCKMPGDIASEQLVQDPQSAQADLFIPTPSPSQSFTT